jgi:hypothetical protein
VGRATAVSPLINEAWPPPSTPARVAARVAVDWGEPAVSSTASVQSRDAGGLWHNSMNITWSAFVYMRVKGYRVCVTCAQGGSLQGGTVLASTCGAAVAMRPAGGRLKSGQGVYMRWGKMRVTLTVVYDCMIPGNRHAYVGCNDACRC